jgi:hypothetical protein
LLIQERNEKGHNISGSINLEALTMNELTLDHLRHYKTFFSAILHNVGNRWDNKDESPFVSTTYGNQKLEVARRFSTPRSEDENSMIFIYYICRTSKYYMLTTELNKMLKDLNVDWYKDIHSEMLLIDGLFPHFNLYKLN